MDYLVEDNGDRPRRLRWTVVHEPRDSGNRDARHDEQFEREMMESIHIYPRDAFSRIEAIKNSPPELREQFLHILDTIFFASLLSEEGEFVPIGVAIERYERLEDVVDTVPANDPSDHSSWFVCRVEPIPFDAKSLKRLAHGIEYGRDVAVITVRGESIEITGIARRRAWTDGGNVLRIAAPRPGVLVLEGSDGQLGIRYDAGLVFPNDVDVFLENGPVLDALKKCELFDNRWQFYRILRHARATKAGAMFVCLPSSGDPDAHGVVPVRFQDPDIVSKLSTRKHQLLIRRIGLTPLRGGSTEEQFEESALLDQEIETVEADLSSAVEMIGRLSANDGAVLVGNGARFVGAGLVLGEMGDRTSKLTARKCYDAECTTSAPRLPSGGARHSAGLRFAWTNPGAVVFVVSTDGPITCVLRVADELLTWSVRVSET